MNAPYEFSVGQEAVSPAFVSTIVRLYFLNMSHFLSLSLGLLWELAGTL